MGYGGLFVTDFGNDLIDETFKSLALISKGTLTTDTAHPLGSSKIFSFIGTHPLLALQDSTPFGIHQQGLSGSNWQVEVWSTGAIGTVINWFLFDDVPAVAPSGYGLAVWNAGGDLVFDSNKKYLRIEDFVHAVGTYTLTAGRSYAAIFANGKERIISVSDHGSGAGWNTNWDLYGADIDSNVVTVSQNNWQSGNGPDDLTYVPGLDLLLIDVTNF